MTTTQTNAAMKTMNVDGVAVRYVKGTAILVRAIVKAADDEGTIQASDMVGLSDNPYYHTTTSMTAALNRIGAEVID